MKFKEQTLKDILQQEQTTWDASDLSWFDQDLLKKLEQRLLSDDQQQKIIAMMAHDQNVMNHYQALKKQAQHADNKLRGVHYFQYSKWALASVLVVSMVILLFNQVDYEVPTADINRGAADTLVYPSDQASFSRLPDHFVVPQVKQPVRVVLRQNDQLVWQSEWQSTPRFLLPLEVRNQQHDGIYQWLVMTEDNLTIHKGVFKVTE